MMQKTAFKIKIEFRWALCRYRSTKHNNHNKTNNIIVGNLKIEGASDANVTQILFDYSRHVQSIFDLVAQSLTYTTVDPNNG